MRFSQQLFTIRQQRGSSSVLQMVAYVRLALCQLSLLDAVLVKDVVSLHKELRVGESEPAEGRYQRDFWVSENR